MECAALMETIAVAIDHGNHNGMGGFEPVTPEAHAVAPSE